MPPNKLTHEQIGQQVETYCHTYSIPLEYFFNILNDQKVVPMLRGKGMEYAVFTLIHQLLNPNEWSVHKLNPNPQPGLPDQDISITHLRTGVVLSVETKSAVRGSFTLGAKSRIHRGVAHFKVKCHRSRSNISLAQTSNDRYQANAFDLLITNPSNALFKVGTIGESLELLGGEGVIPFLYAHYAVFDEQRLIQRAYEDWRFVFPTEIAEEGFIPRTPAVCLADDAHWKPLAQLQTRLVELVSQKIHSRRRSHRSSG